MTRRQKRRSPEQIVRALQEGEAMLAGGKTVAEVIQKLEVSEGTWIRWKNQYGGMKSEEAKSATYSSDSAWMSRSSEVGIAAW